MSLPLAVAQVLGSIIKIIPNGCTWQEAWQDTVALHSVQNEWQSHRLRLIYHHRMTPGQTFPARWSSSSAPSSFLSPGFWSVVKQSGLCARESSACRSLILSLPVQLSNTAETPQPNSTGRTGFARITPPTHFTQVHIFCSENTRTKLILN